LWEPHDPGNRACFFTYHINRTSRHFGGALATTKDGYQDEEAAWEGARGLWQTILDLGYVVTDEGHSDLGTIRRLDRDSGVPRWRGKVRMVLKPL
jgi:hypothetical protein